MGALMDENKKSRKRVLLVATTPLQHDGLTKVLFDFFDNADKKLYSVDVASGKIPDERYAKRIKDAGREFYQLPDRIKNAPKYIRALALLCLKNKYDIVHVHGNSATMAIDLLGAKNGGVKKRIAHSHSTTSEHMLVHKLLKRKFNSLLTDGVACSKVAGEWLFTKPFEVLYNGININDFKFDPQKRKNVRDQYGISANEYVVGHVGRFSYQKNQEYLVKVFVEVLKEKKDCKLMLVGSGETEENVFAKIRDAGIDDKVIHIESSDSVNDLMQVMDVFVLPSRFEGLPIVATEAQAAGLPCILSDVITTEAKSSENCLFVSLSEKEKWKEYILGFAGNAVDRKISEYKTEIAKFDVSGMKAKVTDVWK